MKGFKTTGKGPMAGHSFPKSAGFVDSSGKSKSVNSYVRSVPSAARTGTPKVGGSK